MSNTTTEPEIIKNTIAIKTSISNLKLIVKGTDGLGCTFWACKGAPENNRIESMITCDRCRNIILANREIKRLNKLLTPTK